MTFPDDSDYKGLFEKTDLEIAGIWLAIITPRCSCARHAFDKDARDQLDPWVWESWCDAVYAQVSRRGLDVRAPRDASDLDCLQCGVRCIVIGDPFDSEPLFIACRPCGTMRRLGNHMDCRTGAPQSIPAGW